ncbi:MAG: hypothetical protein GX595_01560 [Lentisphaerae bacterium]|nr:hypothetical protein [Lentisphaerota bacterium]
MSFDEPMTTPSPEPTSPEELKPAQKQRGDSYRWLAPLLRLPQWLTAVAAIASCYVSCSALRAGKELTQQQADLTALQKELMAFQIHTRSDTLALTKTAAALNEASLRLTEGQTSLTDFHYRTREDTLALTKSTTTLNAASAALAKSQAELATFENDTRSARLELASRQADLARTQAALNELLTSWQLDTQKTAKDLLLLQKGIAEVALESQKITKSFLGAQEKSAIAESSAIGYTALIGLIDSMMPCIDARVTMVQLTKDHLLYVYCEIENRSRYAMSFRFGESRISAMDFRRGPSHQDAFGKAWELDIRRTGTLGSGGTMSYVHTFDLSDSDFLSHDVQHLTVGYYVSPTESSMKLLQDLLRTFDSIEAGQVAIGSGGLHEMLPSLSCESGFGAFLIPSTLKAGRPVMITQPKVLQAQSAVHR